MRSAVMMEIEAQLQHYADSNMMHSDALYNFQIIQMRQWCIFMIEALEQEGIEPEVARRVLNRMLFATPSGADARVRIEMEKELTHVLQTQVIPRGIRG